MYFNFDVAGFILDEADHNDGFDCYCNPKPCTVCNPDSIPELGHVHEATGSVKFRGGFKRETRSVCDVCDKESTKIKIKR